MLEEERIVEEEENTDEDGDLPRRRIPRRHYYL